MPQPPFLVDVVQLEPGSGSTLTLSKDPASGSMKFVDAALPAGVLLSDLVGIRNITGVFLVGRSGSGAPYGTIQAALDAIPSSSSAAAPSLVLVFPGVYQENLKIQKDGVYLVGLGGSQLINSGAEDTIEISASTEATPLQVQLRGLRVQNGAAGQACVRLLGADTFATGTVTVASLPLAVGDQVIVGGIPLTGVVGARTSGANNFSISGGTPAAVAAEISAAILDPLNSFSSLVEASPAGPSVNFTAVTAGSAGNGITLAVSLATPGSLTLSGPTLTGGSSAGSAVASQGVLIENCELVASGAGGFQVYADTVNQVAVRGGSWRGSSITSRAWVSNCAHFSVFDLEWANNFELAYDTGNDRPADTTSEYLLTGAGRIREVLVSLVGEGSFSVRNCPLFEVGLTQGGDRTLSVAHSSVGALLLGGTTAATLTASTLTSAGVSAGTPTLSESKTLDTLTFAASASETYTFSVTQPDANYAVLLESPSPSTPLAVQNKTTTGFDVVTDGTSLTGSVGLQVVRAQ
jgi:hypothetical protein